MEDKILDTEIIAEKSEFRLIAFLIEFVSFVAFIIYIVFFWKEYMGIALVIPGMSFVYLLFGWYLFKSEKFNIKEIVTAELVGMYLILCSISSLFILESWEPGVELIYLSLGLGAIIDFLLIHRYIRNHQKKMEYRFSGKLITRVVLFQAYAIYIFIRCQM